MLEADVEVDRRGFVVRASLRVEPGERLALFGPSGAGKTTLLEAIAGLVQPRRAKITLGGRVLTSTGGGSGPSGSGVSPGDAVPPRGSTERPVAAVPPWQRRVGLLRQDPGLFPHLSVRDNLRYGSAWSAEPAELTELAVVLGIEELLAAMPAKLSGGQAHRVALGRLLLAPCDALLLDEPYTGLDAGLRRTLTDLVRTLVARRAVPSILVAHELAEAQAFADRLVVLDRGAVLQCGDPADVVLRPACRRVAELVGYTAFVPVPVGHGSGSHGAGSHGPGSQPGVVAGVHPDRVIAGSHPGQGLVLTGVVTGCRPAGARWEVTVRADQPADLPAEAATLTGRLAAPAAVGAALALTVTEPPCFGPDGAATEPWPPAGPATCDADRVRT